MLKYSSITKLNNVSEYPNPKATMGFVIFYPFQFYALKNIYLNFIDRAEFIIDHSVKEKIPDSAFEKTAQFLLEKRVSFRILPKQAHSSEESLKKFFVQYQALVGLTLTCCLSHQVNRDRIKIRVEYGLGKDLHEFHPNQSKFDLLLLFGEQSLALSKFYTHCAVVGNTRFDDWFNNSIDTNLLQEVSDKLDLRKKKILYLPTHGDLSSLDDLTEELNRLKFKFNIIIKLHHLTVYHDPKKIDMLRQKGFLVFDDTMDALILYKLADVVLGDNSGVLFEALLIKKPLVVADFLDREFFNEHFRFMSPKSHTGTPMTYADSIEQQLKNKVDLRVKRVEELENILEKAIGSSENITAGTEQILKNAFAFNDGKCSLRAKNVIEEFVSLKELPPKPILYYIFEAFAEEVRVRTIWNIKRMGLMDKIRYLWKNFL